MLISPSSLSGNSSGSLSGLLDRKTLFSLKIALRFLTHWTGPLWRLASDLMDQHTSYFRSDQSGQCLVLMKPVANFRYVPPDILWGHLSSGKLLVRLPIFFREKSLQIKLSFCLLHKCKGSTKEDSWSRLASAWPRVWKESYSLKRERSTIGIITLMSLPLAVEWNTHS
jgi:hypothetical protein